MIKDISHKKALIIIDRLQKIIDKLKQQHELDQGVINNYKHHVRWLVKRLKKIRKISE